MIILTGVAGQIAESKKKPKIKKMKNKKIKNMLLDISKAQKDLKFSPQIRLEEGLRQEYTRICRQKRYRSKKKYDYAND